MDGFRSTVLQRPRDDDAGDRERERERDRERERERDRDRDRERERDRDRQYQRHDAGGSPSAGRQPHGSSAFSLRSPPSRTLPPFAASASPNGSGNASANTNTTTTNTNGHRGQSHQSPPRALHGSGSSHSQSPYMAPASHSLPPPGTPSSSHHHQGSSHQQQQQQHQHQHPRQPMSPPRPASYYPPASAAARDKPASGSFYDPTTDTTKERGVSDSSSWHGATTPKTRDPYPYSQDQYYNGRASYNRARSPLSHAHPLAGSHSPPAQMALGANGVAKEPAASPKPTSTPSRADPMSFSNILSSSEPPKEKKQPPADATPKPPAADPEPKVEPEADAIEPDAEPEATEVEVDEAETEVEPEPEPEPEQLPARRDVKKKQPRRSKGRASDIRDAEAPKRRRRSSLKKESPAPSRSSSKRQANGQPKAAAAPRTWSTEMEKKIQNAEMQIDSDAPKLDADEFDEHDYKERASKRRRVMTDLDEDRNRIRREDYAKVAGKRLVNHAELGKRRYDEVFYDEALHEVREQELYAEKERKKDMQRKRRREKSMAVTIEQKEAALARAEAAEDEAERQKHLRDAARADKKAEQTKLILEKGIKGPARNLDLIDGGANSSFLASDAETPKSKKKGARPKKSKEQKQAEKDSAEAAQAALDAGKELPPKEEGGKVRIKIKGRSRGGDKEKKEAPPVEKDPEQEKRDEAAELEKKFTSKGYNQIYEQIWRDMARKDVNKTFKLAVDSYATKGSNLKKTAILASKEAKRWQLRTNKGTKDLQARAKRVMRDMMGFWKRNEREERDLRKAAEKQEIENARREEAEREAARQKRKLNFLISQTELYSHFIGKKIKTDEVERSTDHPDEAPEAPRAQGLNVSEPTGPVGGKVTDFENLDFDNDDESQLQAAAMANAQNAIAEAQKKARDFNNQGLDMDEEGEMNFQNPTGLGDVEIEQPKLLNAQLKEYQLKGLNWLVNLYEQGINGILADEMGLGKTVQSISVMAYLAEKHDIWGPFLVVAPASTLHNWQQEIAKFVPEFKILPYWGSAGDRKVLRKFWDRKHSTYRKDAAFHVCVTSYQLVVSDVAYFQKMRWQYMILDEAQAIKSSSSSRWKSLLGFHCRNRLLLTGTPIQNNMQELWALLHFIMPSLFDSHDEFSEWFSKDIESHAQSNTKLNEDQLKRLHMILKPFMLRRVKKHVQKELGDKIELDVFCNLTYRQRAYYSNLRNQINIMDLVEKATMGDDQDSGTLMNLVMQFRKVCNHPDLFERAEVTSPFSFGYFAETASFVREGNNVPVGYSTRNLINYELPSLVWARDGRLDKAGHDNARAGWRGKALGHMMNIYTPDNSRDSLGGTDAFSWLRFADASLGDVYRATHTSLFARAVDELQKPNRLAHMDVAYEDDGGWVPAHAMLKVRPRASRAAALAAATTEGVLGRLMNVARDDYADSGLGRLEIAGRPRASAPPVDVSCNSASAVNERNGTLFNVGMRRALYGPARHEERTLVQGKVPLELWPAKAALPPPDGEKRRFTNISVPSMRRFVTDSGKLAKLDELLFKLKAEGHRVLLYFQMTRMIDMMEEYLTYRNFKYCRLDGSTKLEDRRDTVHDFQTRPEIFIFLLSTRAGGLGINLTSADTVIFYDSDWNPTIDSQAMDRAHRLGQTKQVTVYRLITRGTIEERIRKRALQKEEVQRVVIQGGGASVDFSGRRAPENRNRDIAMWLADDEQAEMIERREKELLESGELDKRKKGGRRKKAEGTASLDDLYHEGEGNFDDGSKGAASGAATPVESEKGKKKAKGKRAKTAKQRLAIADGMVDY
ncbi:SNF2 family helicase/ATPase [Purpureocillium lilacinum]|uniref:Chromatin-remodeling ATPase INO80 n=1 Tax=Purpureocillium lilacinum TaxID=33203 RepID=A0A179GCA0_PURLI|nr:SNF2 family helicase/ATPase [Purpureocillium lilacinum]